MNDSQTEAPTGWSPMMLGGIGLGGVILLLLILPTCSAPTNVTDGPAVDRPSESNASRSRCERSLQSAIDGLLPSRLGMSSESRVMTDTLNSWSKQCLPDGEPFAEEADLTLRKSLLTDDGLTRTNIERYQIRDAEHIRNSLLAKAIVDNVAADARTDLERAVELFYFVVRTIDLVPDNVIDVPLTPYDSLLFGAGTAADRAWAYALLLRQLRLDCVMIQPRTEGDAAAYWLIGVVIPGQGVCLFDPRLGLPIIGEGDPQTTLPRQPATLTQARDNDGLLRQFDLPDSPYPLTAEVLQLVDVFAIGTSSTWSPRMGRLQAELPEPPELYDGLASNRLRETGLIDRLIAAGSDGLWSAEQVRIWPYPEFRWGPPGDLPESQRESLASRYQILEGPYAISVSIILHENDEHQITLVAEKPQRSLRRARIEQLLGNFKSAQQVYLQTRLSQVNLQEVQNYLQTVHALLEEVQANLTQMLQSSGQVQVSPEQAQAYLAEVQTILEKVQQRPGKVQAYMERVQGVIEQARANPELVPESLGQIQQIFQSFLQELSQDVFLEVQEIIPKAPETRLNDIAADMATFWAAKCQYEQGDYRVAAQSALSYLKRPVGQYQLSALSLASICLAHDGREADAAAVFAQQPSQASQHRGDQMLIKRWRSHAAKAKTPTPPPSKPTDAKKPKPEDKTPADDDAKKPQAEETKPVEGDKPTTDKPSPSKEPTTDDDKPADDAKNANEKPATAPDLDSRDESSGK